MSNLEHALALGSALILIVLYAFLRSWSAALISFLAIPLSLLAAIFVLAEFGQTLNTMTLGGFALALGVLVDDAIIDIENIMRRLRLAKAAGRDDDLQTIEDASIEIRGSMLYGTLAVIFVFLPMLFAGGVQGRFIGPMALTFIIAVARLDARGADRDAGAVRALLTGEEDQGDAAPRSTLMQRCAGLVHGEGPHALAGSRSPRSPLAAAAAIAVAPFLHSELIPQFREGHFVIQMTTAAQGTSVGDVIGDRHPHLQRAAEAAVHARRRPPDRPRRSRRGHLEPRQERVPRRADGRARRDRRPRRRRRSGTCSSISPRCAPRR